MAISSKLQRFKEAMYLVYGAFDSPPSPYLREMASASSHISAASPSPAALPSTHSPSASPSKKPPTLTPPASPHPPWAETWTPPTNPGAGGHKGRYLWTDAFGVLNFLTLHKEMKSELYLTLAKRLVHQVHEVLGRERDPPPNSPPDKLPNRLPGASDAETLKGGLRIGKVDATGRDCDGQYHHYLTLWAYALVQVALAARDESYVHLAAQLMKAIHRPFVSNHAGHLSLCWKMSTDLRHVLVPSTGHLDAVTGLAVTRLIRSAAEQLGGPERGMKVGLEREEEEYIELVERQAEVGGLEPSSDMLDLGMGLWVAHLRGVRDEEWAEGFGMGGLKVAKRVLREDGGLLSRDARHRLAFREFGAVLGLRCFLGETEDENKYGEGGEKNKEEREYLRNRAQAVVDHWEGYLKTSEDEDLRPITLVMYAAALIPGSFKEGYFDIGVKHREENAT